MNYTKEQVLEAINLKIKAGKNINKFIDLVKKYHKKFLGKKLKIKSNTTFLGGGIVYNWEEVPMSPKEFLNLVICYSADILTFQEAELYIKDSYEEIKNKGGDKWQMN